VREHRSQPLDLFGHSGAALPVARLLGQLREQMPQPRGRDRQELAVRRDIHHRLGDRERDDLRIGHASPRVLCPIGQEIVSRGEHGREEQVEVGEHRGPLGRRRALGTDRLRPPLTQPLSTTPPTVESII
jgi:hypothetical protein